MSSRPRTGELQGIEGPVWCGPRVDGELEWRELWDEDEKPYAARVLVYRKGWVKPANGTCKWSEFAVYIDKDRTELGPMWVKMPSHMLGKVAESLALRRAFSDVIPTGNVSEEFAEIDRQPAAAEPAPPDPGRHVALMQADGDGRIVCSCGEVFASTWAFGAHRNAERSQAPTPPGEVAAPEPPPGRPTVVVSTPARPPAAAPNPDNNVWRDGTPMFDPQTGKPL